MPMSIIIIKLYSGHNKITCVMMPVFLGYYSCVNTAFVK